MAACHVSSGNSLSPFADKTTGKQEERCLCCIELRLELQKVKIEILSYQKVIKVLQEELNNNEPSNKRE
jgi:hypothetical protein